MKIYLSLVCSFFVLLAVSLQASPTAYRSVVEFGADGTDEKDDTEAFQKAINAVSEAQGGVVFVPAGRYLINDTLLIKKNGVTLMGEGRGGFSEKNSTGSLLVLIPEKTNTAILVQRTSYSGIQNLSVMRRSLDKDPLSKRVSDPLIKLERTYHSFVRDIWLYGAMSGIELVDGLSPMMEEVDIKSLRGEYGIWLHGSGKSTEDGKYRKIDAALFYRIAASSDKENTGMTWVIIGPNVDGAALHDTRLVGGRRALLLKKGDPEKGDIRPKYVHTYRLGSDHATHEAIVMEAGNDVFMNNTWIGQNKHASAIVIGKDFSHTLLMSNTRVRGAGAHGIHIQGGQNIYISNSIVGANCNDRNLIPAGSTEGAGILIEKGVKNLRIVGGGVGPMFGQGARSRQHYGIRYMGSSEDAKRDSVRISSVDTAGNPVPYSPESLSLDKE